MSAWVLKIPGWFYHRFGTCNTLIQSRQQKHTTNNSRRKIMFINSTHFHNCKNKPYPAWTSFKVQSLSWKVLEYQIYLVLFHPAVSHMKGIGFATSQHAEKHILPSKREVPQLLPMLTCIMRWRKSCGTKLRNGEEFGKVCAYAEIQGTHTEQGAALVPTPAMASPHPKSLPSHLPGIL